MNVKLTRRELLRTAGLVAAGTGLAACAPQVVEVEKEVTRVVEETRLVVQERPVTPPGTLPIVSEPTTLEMAVKSVSNVTDFDTHPFWVWLQEQTGVKLDFVVIPDAEATTKFNLLIASGDLPETFCMAYFEVGLDQQQIMADQGLILPLDDLIEQHGFWIKQAFQEHPELREQMSLLDGKLYIVPHFADVLHVELVQKMWVYEPWLKTLGLEKPTTTNEWYEMLVAFKNEDPNGNGKADEVPMSGGNWWMSTIDNFLMNPFVFTERRVEWRRWMYLENGEIKASFAQPGWREGSAYLNKLYSESLLDPQCFTNDASRLTALGENPEVNLLGACSGGFPAGWTNWLSEESGRWKDWKMVSPLEGPTGLRQCPYDIYMPISPQGMLITNECTKPEVAIRFVDFMYNEEATLRNAWGALGECWRWAEPGERAIGGGQAMFVQLNPEGGCTSGYNGQPTYQTAAQRTGVAESENPTEKILYDGSLELMAPYGRKDMVLPYLVFTQEQSQQVGELRVAIMNLADEAFAQFVTGGMNLGKDWDTYLGRLNDAGLPQLLQIYQDAYDAKYGK